MIFGKNYDRTLWLILSGYENNREVIVDFIKNIPEELFKQIHSSLLVYKEYLNINRGIAVKDREPIELSGSLKVGDIFKYEYEIDYTYGALTIKKNYCGETDDFYGFHMTLYPVSEKRLKKCSLFGDILLGEIICNFEEEYINGELCIVNSQSVDFSLIKLPFDKMLLNSFEFIEPPAKNRYSFVDVSASSQDYSISDLTDDRKLNTLVRSRKRKKN